MEESCSTSNRSRKRKRDSSDDEDALPDNTLAVERSVQAAALKNNLDDASVKKILKKVITNDHVLALVKIREEEERQLESKKDDSQPKPKLTRAKVKELLKASPQSAPWNLENIELTPIKQIPVKTRPEVKALIAQELPEDEDDDEYEPNHEDASEDEHTESCSDLDSQPRTPATPMSQPSSSPRVTRDGPFKVPQDVQTPSRRRLDMDKDAATIALRTRSKLSLSATTIEHIESTFVPPDEVPWPDVDEVWSEFLSECLNPASSARHEDADDEADPEYNVAADPDAADEDEALENSIIKISKKELNDLVTELFHIMPEDITTNSYRNTDLSTTANSTISSSGCWEGKREPMSDDETTINDSMSRNASQIQDDSMSRNASQYSIGKDLSMQETSMVESNAVEPVRSVSESVIRDKQGNGQTNSNESQAPLLIAVNMSNEESQPRNDKDGIPALLKATLQDDVVTQTIEIEEPEPGDQPQILIEQVKIMQQQLRQHIQLATSNYLQLYVHPIYWEKAPTYKEYIDTLVKLVDTNPESSANVCNLRPALELMTTWQETVSANTPENIEMIKFIKDEIDRSRKRLAHNKYYELQFHPTFRDVVANSSVFLYPHLLPPIPYRADCAFKSGYTISEDELLVLGLDQFWKHVENNKKIFSQGRRQHTRSRWGYSVALQLTCTVMFPWKLVRNLLSHIRHTKVSGDPDNPIVKYFRDGTVTPVKHKLLPYNPSLTIYQHPEHELPISWLRYLARTCGRAKRFLKKSITGFTLDGVEQDLGDKIEAPLKTPLPLDFTKVIKLRHPDNDPKEMASKEINTEISNQSMSENLYRVVETSTGGFLVPHQKLQNNTENYPKLPENAEACLVLSNDLPQESGKNTESIQSSSNIDTEQSTSESLQHCPCCSFYRKIPKTRQTSIKEFFAPNLKSKFERKCPCSSIEKPKIRNRLKLLVSNFSSNFEKVYLRLNNKLSELVKNKKDAEDYGYDVEDMITAITYQIKLITRISISTKYYMRIRVNHLFSNFKPHCDNPVWLARELAKCFTEKLYDLYKEFMMFLTAEQANELGMFKDYFVQNCLPKLVDKVEEQVPNKTHRLHILSLLTETLTVNYSSPCELCSIVLKSLRMYPALAEYWFHLFPHRLGNRNSNDDSISDEPIAGSGRNQFQARMDYADHSSSDGDEESCYNETSENKPLPNTTSRPTTKTQAINSPLTSSKEVGSPLKATLARIGTNKNLSPLVSLSLPEIAHDSPIKIQNVYSCKEGAEDCKVEVCNEETDLLVERSNSSASSNGSLRVICDDDIKTEPTKWRKDEDKTILAMLKDTLALNDKDTPLIAIFEDSHLIDILSETLTDRSIDEIEERISYLLHFLVDSSK